MGKLNKDKISFVEYMTFLLPTQECSIWEALSECIAISMGFNNRLKENEFYDSLWLVLDAFAFIFIGM